MRHSIAIWVLAYLLTSPFAEMVAGQTCAEINTQFPSFYFSRPEEIQVLGESECTEPPQLVVQYNYITNLDPLTNLTAISGTLWIKADLLTNLDGLSGLTSLGALRIYPYNGSLLNIDGLAGIASLYEAIIHSNPVLQDVDGLSGLVSVEAGISIYDNEDLRDLHGLASLSEIGALDVIRNASLTDCRGLAPILGWPDGRDDLATRIGSESDLPGQITSNANGEGCNSTAEILDAVNGPSMPVISNISHDKGVLELSFTESIEGEPLFPVREHTASCEGAGWITSESPGLEVADNVPILISITTADLDPLAGHAEIELDVDISHSEPSQLTIKLISPQGTEVMLFDRAETDSDNITGTFPTTITPAESLSVLSSERMNGEWILEVHDQEVGALVREGVLNSYEFRIKDRVIGSSSGSPLTIGPVVRGRNYLCSVAPVTALGAIPSSEPYVAEAPLEAPTAPLITSTDYEDGKIILTVSVIDNGGTDITGYEATCTDGTNAYTGTSTSSPITISGLTNGVAYTCTVTATNSVGTSSVSVPSAPITPAETTTPLPIWLLYQATQ